MIHDDIHDDITILVAGITTSPGDGISEKKKHPNFM